MTENGRRVSSLNVSGKDKKQVLIEAENAQVVLYNIIDSTLKL
jgi:hypothetical protein